MIEGCPDYHRVITPEIAKNYLLELYVTQHTFLVGTMTHVILMK